MPTRNESWILDRTLRTLSTFCDVIIVADQMSTDGTREILKCHAPKVILLENQSTTHSTTIRWKLLAAAREYDGWNFILYTDADEILSSNILNGNIKDRLISLTPGTSILIELVNLWRSPKMWRNDRSVWSKRWMEIGFRDNRCLQYGPIDCALDHNRRLPMVEKVEPMDDVKLLHFQFVAFERMLSKQRWYRALEAVEYGVVQAERINLYYCRTRDERTLHLDPIKLEWTDGWKEMGVDLEYFEAPDLCWYDVEVLRYFREKGTPYFSAIDLWDVNWESKRRLAKSYGYSGIPDEPIVDPRPFEHRLYHAYLHRFIRTPPWRDPIDFTMMPYRWLKKAVRWTGLRRSHLERIGLIQPVRNQSPDRSVENIF